MNGIIAIKCNYLIIPSSDGDIIAAKIDMLIIPQEEE